MEWDPGPSEPIRAIFEQAPLSAYASKPDWFRLAWGPIYYRGRLDGSARVLVIGQDPAANENVARRILVGTAGRRVQGLLAKVGITRSYVMVNASLYSIYNRKEFAEELWDFIDSVPIKEWRNQLLDALVELSDIQAILAFGGPAKTVIKAWPGANSFRDRNRIFFLTHPTADPESNVLEDWNHDIERISKNVPPDPDGRVDLTLYEGPTFKDGDLAWIPIRDFGFGAPKWLGSRDTAFRFYPNQPWPDEASEADEAILWVPPDED